MIINSTKRVSILIIGLLLSSGLLFGKTKVACVGNSITYGWALDRDKTYPTQLQNKLGADYEVSNFGVSGRTLLKKGDKPYWNESAYQQALVFTPEIVIIMLGTNDSKSAIWDKHASEYITDYSALIQSFRDVNENLQVFICMLPPANHSVWDIRKTIIANEINPKILEVAKVQGVNVIDIEYAFQNKAGLMQADGVHPNAKGAENIANKIHTNLTQPRPVLSYSGNTLELTEGFAYYWYKNAVYLGAEQNQKTIEPTNPLPATYQALVKYSGLSNDLALSNKIVVDEIALSVNENSEKKTKVYYNLQKREICIYQEDEIFGNTTFRLFNVQGQLVTHKIISAKNTFIHTNEFKGGMYVFQVKSNGFAQSGRLLIN